MSLRKRLRQSQATVWLGRLAHGGRGLVYIVFGVFIVYTAISQQAGQGWQAAFLAVRDLPAAFPWS